MKFSVRNDTDLSGERLFSAISDFSQIERMLVRRGAKIQRLSPQLVAEKGMAWDLTFDFKGKARELRLEVDQIDRPEKIVILGTGESLLATITMTVIALAANKSRIIFETEVKPRNMRARLMLQTAKLGKANLDRKFAQKIEAFLSEITAQRA